MIFWQKKWVKIFIVPSFWLKLDDVTVTLSLTVLSSNLLGRRQANLCFHFAGSGENLPDIAKSRDASIAFAPRPDEAEQLPVLSHKLPFFS